MVIAPDQIRSRELQVLKSLEGMSVRNGELSFVVNSALNYRRLAIGRRQAEQPLRATARPATARESRPNRQTGASGNGSGAQSNSQCFDTSASWPALPIGHIRRHDECGRASGHLPNIAHGLHLANVNATANLHVLEWQTTCEFTTFGRHMHEPAMTFEGPRLSCQKEVVRAFYKDMWDHADKSLIPKLFHEGFTFRGSLGSELVGYDEFGGYVDWVTGAFGQYTTDILAMIEEGNRVSGKMRFHGYHRRELFGVAPSGRHVWWTGMPIFTFDGPKVRDLYVLGDIYGLIARLKGQD